MSYIQNSNVASPVSYYLFVTFRNILDFATTDTQTYTIPGITLGWSSAKSYCECTGNLVVIDTAEKQADVLAKVYVWRVTDNS